MAKIKVKLKRSLIGHKEIHRRTIRALGLNKISSENILNDTPQVRGMIKQVQYLLEVEEVKE